MLERLITSFLCSNLSMGSPSITHCWLGMTCAYSGITWGVGLYSSSSTAELFCNLQFRTSRRHLFSVHRPSLSAVGQAPSVLWDPSMNYELNRWTPLLLELRFQCRWPRRVPTLLRHAEDTCDGCRGYVFFYPRLLSSLPSRTFLPSAQVMKITLPFYIETIENPLQISLVNMSLPLLQSGGRMYFPSFVSLMNDVDTFIDQQNAVQITVWESRARYWESPWFPLLLLLHHRKQPWLSSWGTRVTWSRNELQGPRPSQHCSARPQWRPSETLYPPSCRMPVAA